MDQKFDHCKRFFCWRRYDRFSSGNQEDFGFWDPRYKIISEEDRVYLKEVLQNVSLGPPTYRDNSKSLARLV